MAIEAYKKERERLIKEAQDKAGVVEEKVITTEEIINDDKKNALFGRMLENFGNASDKALAERLVTGKIDKADLPAIEAYRKEFNERMNKVERIKEDLNSEMIMEIAKNMPEFQELLKHVKPENMATVLKNEMANLAMKNSSEFDDLYSKIKASQDYRKGEMKGLDEEVKEYCKNNNINETEYIKVIANNDPDEREKALTELVRKSWGKGKWGKIRRFFDVGGWSSGGKVEELENSRWAIEDSIAQLNAQKAEIGAVLSSTIKDEKGMFEAFSKAILGDRSKKEFVGFNEVKNVYPDSKEVVDNWKAEIGRPIRIPGTGVDTTWNKMSDDQKNTFREDFMKRAEAHYKKKNKGGFWGSVMEAFFASFIKSPEVQNQLI